MGTAVMGASNAAVYEKIAILNQYLISEVIKDRAIVTMECE